MQLKILFTQIQMKMTKIRFKAKFHFYFVIFMESSSNRSSFIHAWTAINSKWPKTTLNNLNWPYIWTQMTKNGIQIYIYIYIWLYFTANSIKWHIHLTVNGCKRTQTTEKDCEQPEMANINIWPQKPQMTENGLKWQI